MGKGTWASITSMMVTVWLGIGTAGAQSLQTTAPLGFETLDEPQTSSVDVYFGGRSRGSVLATFAPGWIDVSEPETLVDLLDVILPEKREAILAALVGRLDTHSSASCLPERFPGCGTIDVPVAGVIFNPDFFRLDVVVAPSYLGVREMSDRYLPDPVTGPSLIANLSAGGSGSSDDEDQTVTAGIQSRFSVGRSALRLDAYAQSSGDRSMVDVLAGEHYGRDHLFQMGFIEDYATRFSRLPGLLGARFETYLDSRLDLDRQSGSPIFLFLPERSQVELLREGRLMAVRSYEAGNQQIDTSALPRGVYDVTLRVRAASGAVSEETVNFVKDISFPAPGEWQYFSEMGVVADDREGGALPVIETTPVVKAGIARRLLPSLAVSTALGATDRSVLGEIDLRHLAPRINSGLQLAATSDGGVGIGADASLRLGRFGASISGDIVIGSGSDDDGDDEDDDGDDDDQERDDVENWDFGRLEDSRQSLTISASYGWDNQARLQVRGYYRNRDDESWGVGPQFSMPLHQDRALKTDLDLSATYADSESLVFARIRLSYSPLGQPYRASGTVGTRYRQADDGDQGFGLFGNARGTYEVDDTLGGSTLLGVDVGRDVDGTNRLSLGAEAATVYGSGNAAIDLEDRDGDRSILYRGFGRTTFAANRDGAAVGGSNSGSAAILADFDGPSTAGRLAVTAGAGESVDVPAGRSAVLPVGSFRTYSPSARAADDQIVDLRQLDQEVPLYPGNVATVRWTVRRLTSFYGRILQPDGSPMINARILGIDALSLTDTLGYFVVEVEEPGEFQVDPRDGRPPCTISLSPGDVDAGTDIVSAGNLVCG